MLLTEKVKSRFNSPQHIDTSNDAIWIFFDLFSPYISYMYWDSYHTEALTLSTIITVTVKVCFSAS